MAKKYQLTQDGPEVQALLNKVEGLKANQTPEQGVTPTALETLALDGVLYSVVTKAVSDLVNYYTKSETYTKSEVNTMVSAIKQFTIQSVDQLPQPSAATMNILYLVPAEEPKVANEKDEFITVIKDNSYAWEQVGSTAIDLSGYVTTEALNTALTNYVTSDALSTALAGLNDVKYTEQSLTAEQKAQARTNIGATAPEVFVAVYGTTTYEQVLTAYNAGKVCLCFYNEKCYVLSLCTPDVNFYFTTAMSGRIWYVRISNNDSWSNSSYVLELTENRVQTLVGYESATNRYPSTKAVADAITAGKQIFWAEYGVTTRAEVIEAIKSDKVVFVKYLNNIYVGASINTTECNTNNFYFSCTDNGVLRSIYLTAAGGWNGPIGFSPENQSNKSKSVETDKASTSKYPSTKAVWDGLKVRPVMDETSQETVPSLNLENTANKSQDLKTDRESTTKYPSVKAVFDSLGKWGVISQDFIVTGNNTDGYDLTATRQEYGIIPQSFIDRVNNYHSSYSPSLLPKFNEETGYFELNGLTDIAYDEMQRIFNYGDFFRFYTNGDMYIFNYTKDGKYLVVRTLLPTSISKNVINSFIRYNGLVVLRITLQPFIALTTANVNYAFYNSMYSLREIQDEIKISGSGSFASPCFSDCTRLESVKINGLKTSTTFYRCKHLSVESIVYMVTNAANTTAITITLHATAYARCQADTIEYTYNSQTYTGILAYASAKNITIASA